MGISVDKDFYLWRMNIKPGDTTGMAFEFCLNQGIIGVGWSLWNDDGTLYIPKNIDDCERVGKEKYVGSRGFVTSIHAIKDMEIDDLIWTRHEGIYYLCRIKGLWKYGSTQQHIDNDIINYVEVDFVKIGTVDEVPGKVTNCFRAPSTIMHIADPTGDIRNVSKIIYNKKTETYYYDVNPFDRLSILEKLQPEDVEEVISLYLQLEEDYLVYTSTNKLDTQTYEFVAISRDGSHKAFPQVKTGNVPLDGNDYLHLVADGRDKVFLFAVSQDYRNIGNINIVALEKDKIIDFMFQNVNILPPRIRSWMAL